VWLKDALESELVLNDLQRLTHEAAVLIVERSVNACAAEPDLRTLVESGCDRKHVLDLLVLVNSNELPERWLGFRDRAELRAVASKLRDVERAVRTIRPHLGMLKRLANEWPPFATFSILQPALESYRTLIEFFAESDEPTPDIPRELLVAHVVERTGRPCDKEIAGLIAALPGHGGYTAEAHAKWRQRRGLAG
jgi:hypothetical protein